MDIDPIQERPRYPRTIPGATSLGEEGSFIVISGDTAGTATITVTDSGSESMEIPVTTTAAATSE